MQRELTCGACAHWCKRPSDATDLRAARPGECRLNPPAVIPVRVSLGLEMVAAYPVVPPDWPACSHFLAREDGE